MEDHSRRSAINHISLRTSFRHLPSSLVFCSSCGSDPCDSTESHAEAEALDMAGQLPTRTERPNSSWPCHCHVIAMPLQFAMAWQ